MSQTKGIGSTGAGEGPGNTAGAANAPAAPTAPATPAAPPAPPALPAAILRGLRGRLVVFEGADGSGKSTQLRRLAAALAHAGVPYTLVREPGGTPTGESIREVLLSHRHQGMSVRCEMLLYMASRAELVEHVILPALARDELVIADRFVASTLAYQGAAGGLAADEIAAVARVATRSLMPDLILLFDLDQHAAAQRLSPLLDRMEAKGAAFHARVREGYLQQARSDPRRYAVIDARGDESSVWTRLCAALHERVPTLPPVPVRAAPAPGARP